MVAVGIPSARAMRLAEVGLIIDYFHRASPEFLDRLGVDPTRIPDREQWHERFQRDRKSVV